MINDACGEFHALHCLAAQDWMFNGADNSTEAMEELEKQYGSSMDRIPHKCSFIILSNIMQSRAIG